MAALTLGAIGGAILGGVSWFASLPNEFKYLIFLGGLATDTGVATVSGIETGAVGGVISFIISNAFVPSFVVTSFQLLVAFTAMPIIFFLMKNGRMP